MSIFNDLNLPFAPAGECKPRLRQMLLTGGMASWFDGKHKRTISHMPELHRPLNRLPWPLSKMQPHLIEFRLYEGDVDLAFAKPVFERLYRRAEIQVAIDAFLQGSSSDDAIVITEDR